MMPTPRNFDDVDGKERGQKKTDDLRAMTTLGPRTLVWYPQLITNIAIIEERGRLKKLLFKNGIIIYEKRIWYQTSS